MWGLWDWYQIYVYYKFIKTTFNFLKINNIENIILQAVTSVILQLNKACKTIFLKKSLLTKFNVILKIYIMFYYFVTEIPANGTKYC